MLKASFVSCDDQGCQPVRAGTKPLPEPTTTQSMLHMRVSKPQCRVLSLFATRFAACARVLLGYFHIGISPLNILWFVFSMHIYSDQIYEYVFCVSAILGSQACSFKIYCLSLTENHTLSVFLYISDSFGGSMQKRFCVMFSGLLKIFPSFILLVSPKRCCHSAKFADSDGTAVSRPVPPVRRIQLAQWLW